MGVRIVRISKASAPNKAQWTFGSQKGRYRWRQSARDGTVMHESRTTFPTLDEAKLDAAKHGWTPAAAGLAYKVE